MISITGVPTGDSLSAGTKNSDGSWTLTPAQLDALTLTEGAGGGEDVLPMMTIILRQA